MAPIDPPDAGVMTVRTALALAPVRRGQPEVVAGQDALGRSIRWVASGDVAWIARDLKGGELLLTTGLGIGRRAAEQRRYVDALCERGVAAMAIELGGVMEEPPRPLVERAEQLGLPVIALHREVPFVEITEAIHGAIVNRQYAFLRRGEAIHRRFTELVLEGQGIPEVMEALAAMIADPVVLENARGELLHHAVHGAATEAVLDAWDAHRRERGRGRDGAIDSVSLPLPMGDGAEAGRLIALAVDSPLDDYDRVAVERAVGVIALALLRARQEEELTLRGRGEFLAELASGTLDPEEARHRAAALGLAHRRSTLLPLAVAIARRPHLADAAVWAPVARRLRAEIDGLGVPALLGDRPRDGDLLMLAGIGDPSDRDWLADRLAAVIHAAVEHELGGGHGAAVAVGGAVRTWGDAAHALRDTAETAAFAREAGGRGWHDASEPDVDRLLWVLRDDPDLRRFADRRLAPLVDHDARRKNTLLPTLEALCDQGWQKAAAARDLLVPRQVLYRRIERIARLLDADPDDPHTRLGLELAVRARRRRASATTGPTRTASS